MSDNPYGVIVPKRSASLEPGRAYHDIPGVKGPTHRGGSAKRAEQINSVYNVDKKTGFDFGCSVGGVSFGLAQLGATMHGFDTDESSIQVGQQHAKESNASVILAYADLSDKATVDSILVPGMYDFGIWLANWMWIAADSGVDYAKKMLKQVSETVPVLFFETAQAGGSQAGNHGMNTPADVERLLRENTVYNKVQDLGPSADGWMARNTFMCS